MRILFYLRPFAANLFTLGKWEFPGKGWRRNLSTNAGISPPRGGITAQLAPAATLHRFGNKTLDEIFDDNTWVLNRKLKQLSF